MGGLAGLGGEEDQALCFGAPPGVKPGVAVVLDHLDAIEIIHARAPERGAGKGEAGGMDDVDGDAKARAQAQQSARVEGDIGLIEGKREGHGRHLDEKLLQVNWV